MKFVVYEDLEDAEGPAVHSVGCKYFKEKSVTAPTSNWHTGYTDYEDAVTKARAIRSAKEARLSPPCCKPGP